MIMMMTVSKLTKPVRHLLGDERAEANRFAWKDEQMRLRTCGYPLIMACVKSIVNGYNIKPYFIMIRRMDTEIWKRGKHASTCRFTSIVACGYGCKAGYSKVIHQISAQCTQPFSRYGKALRTCALADIHNLTSITITNFITYVTRIVSAPLYPHTKVQYNASSRSWDTYKGYARAHVQVYLILTFLKHSANQCLITH